MSGRLSGERFGGRSCADAIGAIVDIAISVARSILEVGEMFGETWRCRADARGAIRAANRQRTENNKSEKMTIYIFFIFCGAQYDPAILKKKNRLLQNSNENIMMPFVAL